MPIRTKRWYRQFAKMLGLKDPKRYAAKMYRKQYEKHLPHGLIQRFEAALRCGRPVSI